MVSIAIGVAAGLRLTSIIARTPESASRLAQGLIKNRTGTARSRVTSPSDRLHPVKTGNYACTFLGAPMCCES